jgi:hypothetical protein
MACVDSAGRLAKLARVVKVSFRDLFDQSKPFGRLALVHVLVSAGSTLVTISLAGSLFFSISPKAAEGKVVLYLLLTVAPFAVVAPALSPLLDRSRSARRAAVAGSAWGSAIACYAMSMNVNGLLLFPEAFAVLVLNKLYTVTKAALVPLLISEKEDLASANAKLAVLAGLAGFAVAPLGVGLLHIGAAWALRFAAGVMVAAGVFALRLPRLASEKTRNAGESTASAAAAGTAFVTAGDATLSGGGARPAGETALPPPEHEEPIDYTGERRRLGLPRYPAEVMLGLNAMSVIRGTTGFLTFFLAFGLRRMHAATWWYGFVLLAIGVGALIGSMVVPRLRHRFKEHSIILFSLIAILAAAIASALLGSLAAQPLLTFVVGVAGATARPSFDSIAQHNLPPLAQGRAFARFETRFQLIWVGASLIPVLIPIPLRAGNIVVAIASGVGAIFYASMRHAGVWHSAAAGPPLPKQPADDPPLGAPLAHD